MDEVVGVHVKLVRGGVLEDMFLGIASLPAEEERATGHAIFRCLTSFLDSFEDNWKVLLGFY